MVYNQGHCPGALAKGEELPVKLDSVLTFIQEAPPCQFKM
jgi:hypothetical protein